MTRKAVDNVEVKLTIKDLVELPETKEKFKEMLGDNAMSFLYSSLQVSQRSIEISKCDPKSLLNAFEVCASMGLSFEPSLGWAFIGVEKLKHGLQWLSFAQFQIGYKGLIELGHRSDKFKGLNADNVREGEYLGTNRETGESEWSWITNQDEREKVPIAGFVAFFELTNGFKKSFFMTVSQMTEHGKKWSKTFSDKDKAWQKDFNSMGKKTALKLLLDKYAPKSIEMIRAIRFDQAIIDDTANGIENAKLNYSDNPNVRQKVSLEENNRIVARQRVVDFIEKSKSLDQLEKCVADVTDEELINLFEEKKRQLKSKK